ncbi:Metalloendoproteinase 1 [Apostasia shenzhenica]|uniref:Metalloendoproteinase 1 n=1 Tax=Apostasia shenzhenica TaxID=1088818 RepID=A0A2I0AZZ1_9ASPA|nr:Metalloendoproteinase 1 [Apostasia shenzhenica]
MFISSFSYKNLISSSTFSNKQISAMKTPWRTLLLFLLQSLPINPAARPAPEENTVNDAWGYLRRFGYLSAKFSGEPCSRRLIESAFARYQSNHGLPHTAGSMSSPRCGVPDSIAGGGSGVFRRFAYFPGQPRWARPKPMRLTYALSPTDVVGYLGRPEVEEAMRRSFARWAKVIPVSFPPAEDYGAADVKIGFYEGDHGDGEPFDGVLGVLAHAFSPESGQLHLDAAERWAVNFSVEASEVAIDLESVITHEIGHVLGLAHSLVPEAVMYPSLSPRIKKIELRIDDIRGIQALYGSNPNFTLSSLIESDTSSSSPSSSSSYSKGRGRISQLSNSRLLGFIMQNCIGVILVMFLTFA